ncbi:MAG: DEAD/DEAH box helicase, partial [Gammaproteobacteria bacterium]|nr:DEAD/DEAH box helicase [Gammaproteobacteria bacterium]
LVRDAEWIVRRVDHAPGGYQAVCDGVSELVRGREMVFLSALDTIEALDPAETRLVPDTSPQFIDARLYMEALLRQAVPNDGNIHIGHTAAMNLVPYQLEPARLALSRPRQRILIADAVGLGKTLEAGILVSELIARGRGRRILVLAVKSMLTQFQKEFWNRFAIPLTRLDSVGIQRVRSRIPTNHNPFHYYDKTIISIDTLKSDAEYRTHLEQATWDIIVIDEAHNVADRGTSSLRSRLAKLLSRRSDTLIMLSATPHDGRARSFASLVNMLDATAIANPDDYTTKDFRPGLVIRRFKKDIQDQVRDAFQNRTVHQRKMPASAPEEAAFEALLAVQEAASRGRSSARDLFVVTLEKALFSSPAACVETASERIRRRSSDEAHADEVAALENLQSALESTPTEAFSKYQALLAAIREGKPFHWRADDPEDRLVIFTERIATLEWLKAHLAEDLSLRPGQVETLHGGMSDIDQQRIVEDFGNSLKPVRLLICSDVASEGINLHYKCHRLIHFDIPWSLMVFAQRNGRVDRYGQTHAPQIVYLVTESANDTIRGDTRILEVLIEKDEQAHHNIGDPSAFMDVHDVEQEERITSQAVANGDSANAFSEQLTPKASEGEDFLSMFLQSGAAPAKPPEVSTPPPPFSLFENELRYAEAALYRLQNNNDASRPLRFDVDATAETLAVDAPDDLVARYGRLAAEVLPASQRLHLTISRDRMAEAIDESRRSESSWPNLHYLWRLSPVVEWLNDRMLVAFGRFQAPILSGMEGLAPDEAIIVCSGLVPNLKSHPLVHEWIGVSFVAGKFNALIDFQELAHRTGLDGTTIINREQPVDTEALSALLPEAVGRATTHFTTRRDTFENAINTQLNEEVAALDEFKDRRLVQLQDDMHASHQARREIEAIYSSYWTWIEQAMTTEPHPSIKVICAITPRL